MSNSGYMTGYVTEVVSDPESGYGMRAVTGSVVTVRVLVLSGTRL